MKHTVLWIFLSLFLAIAVGEFALLIAIHERQCFEGRLKAVEVRTQYFPAPKPETKHVKPLLGNKPKGKAPQEETK
jgi:hypothetical protein